MRGRDVFMASLVAHGVRHIFGNPGTTESPLMEALGDAPGIDYIVALHEGVAVGAASHYAQATGRTGIVNLHVAPGLGNAIGMIYGALKANSPMIVTAGQQDTRMRLRDPLLSHDLVAMAAPVTKWAVQVERADEFAPLLRRAFKVAHDAPAGPVFVGLPIDVMEQETSVAAVTAGALYRRTLPDPAGVEAAVARLLAARSPAIVCGDAVAQGQAHEALLRLAEATGAPVWFEGLRMHCGFPSGHPNARGVLPFDAAGTARALAGHDVVLLVGGPFFEDVWYAPGSPFPDGCEVIQLEETPARLGYNYPLAAGLLGTLSESLRALVGGVERGADVGYRGAAAQRNAAHLADREQRVEAHRSRVVKSADRRPMSMARAMAELAAAFPPETVVVDESITANQDLSRSFGFERPGDYFGGRGGGIGQALAGAIGVRLGTPAERPVACISGDGSAMYSIQALWTAAHHDLPIVFVILANREYRVLKHNIDIYRTRFAAPSNRGYPHMDLGGPGLGFVELAAGMGVAAERVDEPDAVAAAVSRALTGTGPYLIELSIEGKA